MAAISLGGISLGEKDAKGTTRRAADRLMEGQRGAQCKAHAITADEQMRRLGVQPIARHERQRLFRTA